MKLNFIIATFLFWIPLNASAEIVILTDGRSVDLKSDGTYAFLETKKQILITAFGCKNKISSDTDKDDFNNIVRYRYFPGFSLQYKITNNTEFPLVVRQLAHEFSRDYGIWGTLLKTSTYADPIEPGKSLMLARDPHYDSVTSEEKLDDDQIEALKVKYGCSIANLAGQKVVIDSGLTKMKFPPDAGNLDPISLLIAVSKIEGLSAEVR